MIDYNISWSVYIQAKTVRHIRDVHLPPIVDWTGVSAKKWVIEPNEAGDGQTRLMAGANYSAPNRRDAAIHVLGLAGRIASGWSVGGLELLNEDGFFHVTAHRRWQNSPPRPPALTDVLIEAEEGHFPRGPISK